MWVGVGVLGVRTHILQEVFGPSMWQEVCVFECGCVGVSVGVWVWVWVDLNVVDECMRALQGTATFQLYSLSHANSRACLLHTVHTRFLSPHTNLCVCLLHTVYIFVRHTVPGFS